MKQVLGFRICLMRPRWLSGDVKVAGMVANSTADAAGRGRVTNPAVETGRGRRSLVVLALFSTAMLVAIVLPRLGFALI